MAEHISRPPICLTTRPPITGCVSNILQNPGFEGSGSSPPSPLLFPWTISSSAGTSVSSSTSTYPGGYGCSADVSISSAADFTNTNVLSVTVSQSVSIDPTLQYFISFKYYVESPPLPEYLSIFCYIDSPANGAQVLETDVPATNTWNTGQATVQVATPASPVSALTCGIDASGPVSVYLDEIVLFPEGQC